MSELIITGLGCHSAVGLGVDQTCASIRAGVARLQACEEFLPLLAEASAAAPPEPITFAPAPGLPSRGGLERRLVALAAKAVTDLAPRSGMTRAGFRATRLLLALPENAREGIADLDAQRIAVGVSKATSLAFAPGTEAFHAGHAAALAALDAARQFVSQDAGARCLIVAIDSNVLDPNLERLDKSWRLKSQRNVDGFIPGEAGVAMLVESADAAARRGAPHLSRVTGVGIAEEPSPSTSDAHSTGAGLSRAIDAACPDAPSDPIGWIICDLNGESYRGREWGLVVTRLSSRFQSPVLWHPADSTGDLGAASGALHVAMASRAFTRGYAPADRALVYCASDAGTRAACAIRAASEARAELT